MQRMFDTQSVSFLAGLEIIGVGVALLIVLEAEKFLLRWLRWIA